VLWTTHVPAERARVAWLGAALFLLLTVPRLLLHELWRDEAWLWLVVTDQPLTGLLGPGSPLARSGQGYLFPLLCALAARLSTSSLTMQVLHGLLAAAAAFVVLRWAPWDRRAGAIFVLGYFPFYEYAVISRHYVLGALLVWLACAVARTRWSVAVGGAALGLVCQTTVYGFILALALASGWLLDRFLRPGEDGEPPRPSFVAVGLSLALAGGLAGLLQLHPLPGTTFAAEWRFDWEPARALRVLAKAWDGLVPLPIPRQQFWNSNVLDPWPQAHSVAGLLALGLTATLLWRRTVALVTFAVGGMGLLAFSYLKYVGTLRHHGHWWLLFAAALWLGGPRTLEGAGGRPSWRHGVLIALLGVHGAAGVFASWMDLRHPFSNAAATAQLIRAQGLDRLPLVAGGEPTAAPVSLALGLPLYFPGRGSFGRYPDWGPRQRELGDAELRCAARELARREGRDVMLVMARPLPAWEEIEITGSRLGAIQPSEDYRLYRLRHDRLGSAGPPGGCAVP
jgi:hypothetical protein